MNINRHNYEEYFLLYVDNELNIAQRKTVESFIAENPDLKAELEVLQESVLPADESIVFSHKESLLRTSFAPNPVNDSNCEEYFVLYADDELTNQEKDLVEQFVYRNPQHQASFELIQQVKLMPDTSIVFPDKYALYRKEEDDKKPVPIIRMRWWKIAAAAVVLFFIGGMGWYLSTDKGTSTPATSDVAVNTDTNKTQQPVTVPQPKEEIADATPTQQDQQQAPALAVTTEQQKKAAAQQQPGLKTPVKKDDAVDVAVRNNKKENNIEEQRNIIMPPIVTPTEEAQELAKIVESRLLEARKNTQDSIARIALAQAKVPVKVEENGSNTKNSTFGPETNPDIETTLASVDNKKNKMRGFFRKVSRVFEKTANLDADGNEKRGIRIASFEIALK
jgi:hypothetical protein